MCTEPTRSTPSVLFDAWMLRLSGREKGIRCLPFASVEHGEGSVYLRGVDAGELM